MFYVWELCEPPSERGRMRISEARFAVHSFAANASVNSPLRCLGLDGQRARLWKPLSVRRNVLHTIARRACTITTLHLITFVENILLSRARYGVFANVGRLARTTVWEFAPRTLSGCLDTFTQGTVRN